MKKPNPAKPLPKPEVPTITSREERDKFMVALGMVEAYEKILLTRKVILLDDENGDY